MKRYLSLLLLITILCSMCISNITASASIDDVLFVRRNVTLDEYACPAPILKYQETEEGGYIICTYRPDVVNRFLLAPATQEISNAPKSWSTHIFVDFKIDDGEWLSDLGYLDNAAANMFVVDHVYSNPISEPIAFVFADIRQYNELNDTDNIYQNIISKKDEIYSIDWTKHMIEVRLLVDITFGSNSMTLPISPSTVLGEITNNEISTDTKPIELPTPKLTSVAANAENHFISYQLFEDSNINALLASNHDIKTLVKYSINGENTSEEQTINITSDIYTAVAMPENITDNDTVNLEIAYYDATTNTTSNWAKYPATIQVENAPGFVMPPLQGDNAESVIQMQSEHKCGLCGACPAQPLNICLWMWGCMGVAVIAIIVCVVSIIIDARKKKA